MVSFFKRAFLNPFFEDQNRYFLWIPIFFGLGVLAYFTEVQPPAWALLQKVMAAGLLFFVLSLFQKTRVAALPLLFLALGFLMSHLHTSYGGTFMVKKNFRVPDFRGEIEEIEYKESGRRLKLKVLDLNIQAEKPLFIRLTLKGDMPLGIGDIFKGPIKLMPILHPLTPDGFDFRRKAYFEKIGGTAFLEGPATITPGPVSPWSLEQTRCAITQSLHHNLPGQTGAIASAFLTGQTAKIDEDTRQNFSSTGIAHLLAIAGLHFNMMGLIIFVTLRLLFSTMPFLFLRWNIKKVSAALTLGALFIYLKLSGSAIPCQRAFAMTALLTLAVLLDRLTLSLRSLAMAALCILMISPHFLLTPSFQLSFAAVAALISLYESQSAWVPQNKNHSTLKRYQIIFFKSLMTTVITSIAVTPYTMFHFHQLTLQSIVANLLGIPLMAIWIMPLLFIGTLMMPLGLEHYPFQLAGYGIDGIQAMAASIATWPGACIYITHPPAWSLGVFSLAFLWLVIWRQKWRYYSLPFLLVGSVGLFLGKSPDLFISQDAKYIAVKDGDRLLFSGKNPKTFLAKAWAGYAGVSYKDTQLLPPGYVFQGKTIHLSSEEDIKRCPQGDIIIAKNAWKKKRIRCPRAEIFLDFFDMRFKGPYVVSLNPMEILSRKDLSRHWPWS